MSSVAAWFLAGVHKDLEEVWVAEDTLVKLLHDRNLVVALAGLVEVAVSGEALVAEAEAEVDSEVGSVEATVVSVAAVEVASAIRIVAALVVDKEATTKAHHLQMHQVVLAVAQVGLVALAATTIDATDTEAIVEAVLAVVGVVATHVIVVSLAAIVSQWALATIRATRIVTEIENATETATETEIADAMMITVVDHESVITTTTTMIRDSGVVISDSTYRSNNKFTMMYYCRIRYGWVFHYKLPTWE